MLCSVTETFHKMTLTTLFIFLLLLRISVADAGFNFPAMRYYFDSYLPTDAVALLSFKSAADLDNKLLYSLTESYDYCQWRGVECDQDRVVSLVLDGVGLRGRFSSETLNRLDQLRVLSLEDNSLFGSVPDLSLLVNLKSLSLGGNDFSGAFPASILSLRRLSELDLSNNNFSGSIPSKINVLSRLTSLNLEFNRFNGTLPPLNQSSMASFNVSGNNLTGSVPVTPTLSRFNASAFLSNPWLCGEIVNRSCGSLSPIFKSPNATAQTPIGQSSESAQAQNGAATVLPPVASVSKEKQSWLVIGFTIGLGSLIILGFCLIVFSLVMRKRRDNKDVSDDRWMFVAATSMDLQTKSPVTRSVPILNSNFKSQKREDEKEEKTQIQNQSQNQSQNQNQNQATEMQKRTRRNGDLVFCGRESESESEEAIFTLEELMRASAELLGRGSVGTTYKAVMINQLIVTVKRFAPSKTAITSDSAFENHMNVVSRLRHSNLVPIKAYFQSNGERLVIYDYQPNGSLFNLIHGSRASKTKPLHWTSCLKIAEDVAQALHYIHQSPAQFHGNLKSTNILLGQDFEACLTDYCLTILTDSSITTNDLDISSYKAPEIRKFAEKPTSKCDVYSFGVFLLELLSGKTASKHPLMGSEDMLEWIKAMRLEDDKVEEVNGLGMMTEMACICRVNAAEQRPEMSEVIKMIQEIKESVVMVEDIDQYQFE